jgi:hypothetical protein
MCLGKIVTFLHFIVESRESAVSLDKLLPGAGETMEAVLDKNVGYDSVPYANAHIVEKKVPVDDSAVQGCRRYGMY